MRIYADNCDKTGINQLKCDIGYCKIKIQIFQMLKENHFYNSYNIQHILHDIIDREDIFIITEKTANMKITLKDI